MARLGLLVLFAAGTLAAPFMVLDEHLPRAQLKDNGCSTLRFPGVGEKFMYDYAGETLSTVAGSTNRKTGMKINAKVSVAAVSKCSFLLEVSSAELSAMSATDSQFKPTPESAKFKQELVKYQMLFSLGAKGEVESVHAHKMEPTNIVNIKRGIVSALQLDQDAKVETDVNGVCDVEVTTVDGKIVKTKDLAKCSKRAVNEIGLQSTSMQSESNLKPLACTSKCTYEVSPKSIKSVVCEETHTFRPFSAGYKQQAGAITSTKATVNFVAAGRSAAKPKLTDFQTGKSLVFDHSGSAADPANTITGQAETIMKSLASSAMATQSSARDFQNLVSVLRKMDEKRLEPVWNQYFDCIKSKTCEPGETELRDVYRQYLLDAVTYCGSPACISMVRDVIVSGQIDGERMNMFLQGIALVGKSELTMVRDVLLIAKRMPSRQAFLTLGTLIHRQCQRNANDCHYDPKNPITQAETYLESLLGQECEKQADHQQLESMLMSLKAIGNAGRPANTFSKILACGINSQHGNLTVAAFHALRHMPCSHRNSEQILAFVSNEDACPEKRTHAFRALIKCPDMKIMHKLVHRLEVEPSRQLGSYMWTTLTNILESSDPKHADCRRMLEKITANKPLHAVNMPMHQFSKNFEKSFLIDKLESGVTAEGDVIFNPDGYLPRAAFFNLTANVMGVPVHIVEASAQANGIETLLEDVFGPEGMFPDNTVFKLFNVTLTKEKLMEMSRKRNERQDNEFVNRRTRRSAKNSVESNLNDLHKKVNSKRDIPSGSLSFKIMGQEVRALSYDDLFWAIDKVDNMNVITMLLNVAKGGKKSFSKSMIFLEMTHTVPTGLGLPLKLKLVGSTVSTVELEGKFDIRNMFWGPSSLNIRGSIKPSASVEVTGKMGVYSQFVDTGLTVSNTMHTSQFLKGAVEYKQGQKLQVNLDTPDEPVQLFNFSSTPFLFMNEQSSMIEGAARKINPDVCTKSVVLGFGLCTSVRIPVAYRDYEAPYYPLSGPSHFGMKLVKADAKLTTYQFLAKLAKKGDTTTGVLSLSTPGATYERKIEGDMSYKLSNNVHTFNIGTDNVLGATGKRAEMEVSYDAISHSIKLGSKSNLITPEYVKYDFSIFNETTAAGRAFGIRTEVAYGKYSLTTENKAVKTKTGAMLQTKATYYPGKSVTGTLEFNQISKKVFARFDADQFKQLAVEVAGQYISRDSYKGVSLTATHLMSQKKASITGGVESGKLIISGDVNGKSAKTVFTATKNKVGIEVDAAGNTAEIAATYSSKPAIKVVALSAIVNGKGAKVSATVDYKSDKVVVFDADFMGRKAQTSMGLYTAGGNVVLKATATAAGKTISTAAGYYAKDGKKTFKWEGDVAGRHFEVFSNYLITENQMLDFGASMDQYVYGFRNVYSTKKGQSVCTSAYYSVGKGEVTPYVLCARYQDFKHDHGYVHKVVTFSADFKQIKQNFENIISYEKHAGHVVLKTSALQNGNEKAFSTLDLTYGDLKNSQAKITIGSGKKTASLAAYTKKTKENQDLGVKAEMNGKSIAAVVRAIIMNSDYTLKSMIIVNDKTLPISAALRYYRGVTSGTELSLTVKDMSVVYASTFENKKEEKAMNGRVSIKKAGKEIFAVYKNNILVWSPKTKSIEQQFGAIISGKKYQYGYTFQILDKSTASKSAIAARFILAYSTTRSNSLTFTVANGAQTTEFHADLEYLPGSHIKQMIVYNKVEKKLDISFELLPKMYVKYTARLNKYNKGLKSLTHDLSFQMDKTKKSVSKAYKQGIQWVNEYIKNDKNLKMATKFGKQFSVTYERLNAKSSVATLKMMKTKVEFITTFVPARNAVMFRFLVNGVEKFSSNVEYKNQKAELDLTLAGKQLQLQGMYIAAERKFAVKCNLNNQPIVTLSMQNRQNTLSFKVKTAGSSFEVVGRKENSSLFTKFNVNNKMLVQFAAKVDTKTKSLILSADCGKTTCGLEIRADYKNMIAALKAFCNKKVIGWEATAKGNSLVIELNFTPTKSVLITFELQADRIIKVIFSRKSDQKVFDEIVTQIKLTPEMLKLAFSLNKETINKMINKLTGAAVVAEEKVRRISRRSVDAVKEAVKNVDLKKTQKQAMDIIAEIEDFLTKQLEKTDYKEMIQKIRVAAKKSLEQAAKALDQLKSKMPELVKQVKAALETIKSQMKKIDLTPLKQIAKDQLKEVMKYNKVLQKKIAVLTAAIEKVVKSLTKSSKPVIAKVIKVVKNLKIRGQTVESIVKLVVKKGEKYIRVYIKLAKDQLDELEKQGKIMLQKGTVLVKQGKDYVLRMKVPCCNMTTEQAVKFVIKKFNELKKQLNNVELAKIIEKIQTAVLTYKFDGKTIEQHFAKLQAELRKLPAASREGLKKAIKLAREYIKDAKQYKKLAIKYQKLAQASLEQAIKTLKEMGIEVADFAKPITDYAALVSKSVNKNFGPLAKKTFVQIRKSIMSMKFDTNLRPFIMKQLKVIEKVLLPLLKPIDPLYKNIKAQIRKIEVLGTKVGPVFDAKLEKLQTLLQEYIKASAGDLAKIMTDIKAAIEIVNKISPEKMVDMAFNKADKMAAQTVKDIQTAYKQRKELMQKTLAKATEMYTQLKQLSEKLNEKSVKASMDVLLKKSGEIMAKTSAELKSLAEQLSKLDVEGPALKAWKDIVGQLKSYGINSKIIDAIEAAKKMNPTKRIQLIVKELEKKFNELYDAAFVKAVLAYNKIEEAAKYMKTIPKKTYEEWFAELKKFVEDNKIDIVAYFQKTYGITKEKAEQLFKNLNAISNVDFDKIMGEYVSPAKKVAEDVADRARRVRRDIAQPTKDLKDLYTGKLSKFTKANTDALYNRLVELFNKLQAIVEKNYAEISKDIVKVTGETMDKVEKVYAKFMATYGDMTWEQISATVYKKVEKQVIVFKKLTEAEIQRLMVLIEKLKKIAKTTAAKVNVEYKQVVAKAKVMLNDLKKQSIVLYKDLSKKAIAKYEELKPQAIAKLNKLVAEAKKVRALTIAKIEELKKMINEYIKQGKQLASMAKSMGIMLYEQNKNKSIREVFTDVKQVGSMFLKSQMMMVKAELNSKLAQIKLNIAESKKLYKKYLALVSSYMPEIKKELTSITNQLVLGYAEISQEIAIQFYPQYKVVRDELVKYANVVKVQIAKVEKMLKPLMGMDMNDVKLVVKKNIDMMVVYVKQLVAELKKRVDNMDFQKIEELKQKVDEMVKVAQKKFNELKKNPQLIRVRQMAMKTLRDIKNNPNVLKTVAQLKKMEKLASKNYVKYSKMALKEYTKAIQEYKEQIKMIKNNPSFIKAMKTLKKLSKSADFTVSKLAKKLQPIVEKIIKDLTVFIEAAPATCKQAYEQFQKNPEKTFWAAVDESVKQYQIAMKSIRKIKPSDVRSALLKGQKAAIDLADECTDDFAKQTAKKVVKQATKTAKDITVKAKALAKDAKKTLRRVRREAPVMAAKYMKVAKKEADKMANKINKDAKMVYEKYGKPIVESEIWEDIAKEIQTHEIAELVRDLIKLIKKAADIAIKETTKVYNKAAAKAAVLYKQVSTKVIALWNEKFPQLMKKINLYKNEIVSLWNSKYPVVVKRIQELTKLAIAKFQEIRAACTKTCAEMKTKINKLVKDLKNVDVEKQVEMVQKFITEQIAELKVKAAKLQKVAINNLMSLKVGAIVMADEAYKAAYKFVDQTKLVDIENFIKTTIADIQKLIKQVQEKVTYLQANYKKIAAKLVKDAKMIVETNVAKITKVAKAELEKLIATYKPKIMAVIKEYEALFNKYKAISMKKFNELKATSIKMYNAYKSQITAALKQYQATTLKVFNAYKAKVMELVKKIQAAVLKYKNEAVKMYNTYKPKVIAFLSDYQAQTMKIYNEVKPKVVAFLKKVEALIKKYKAEAIKVYNQYKPIVIARINEYKVIATKKFNEAKVQLLKLYNTYKPQAVAKYEEIVKKVTARAMVLINKYKPQVVAAYKKLEKLAVEYKKLALEYKSKAIKLALEYKSEAIKMYQMTVKNLKSKAMKVYTEYKPKIEAIIKQITELVKKYKAEAVKMIQVYKAEFLKVYEPIIVAQVKKYQALAMKYKDEAATMLKEYKKQVNSVVAPIIAKYKPQVIAALNKVKAILIAKYNEKVKPIVEKYQKLIMPIVKKCTENAKKAYADYSAKIQACIAKYQPKVEEMIKIVKVEIAKVQKQIEVIIAKVQKQIEIIKKDPKAAVEFVKKQIVELIKVLKAKAQEVKAAAEKALKNVDVQKVISQLKQKALELKAMIEKIFNKYKTEAEKLVKDLQKRWDDCLAKCQKDIDLLTKEVKSKVAQLKSAATLLAKEVESKIAQTKSFAKFLKNQIEMTIANPEPVKKYLIAKALEVKAIVEKNLMKLKAEIERLIKLAQAKVVKSIAESDKLIKDLKAKALVLYTDMKAKVETCVEKYTVKAKALYVKSVAEYTKLINRINEIIKELKAKAVELKQKAIELKSLAIKTWESSVVRKSLNSLKKMTIRQTIQAIKKLPAATKKMVIEEFNRIRAIVIAEFNARYGEIVAILKSRYGIAVDMYKKIVAKAIALYKEKYAQAIALYKEKYAQAIALYKEKSAQAIAMYNKMSAKALAIYNMEYAKVMAAYKKAIAKFEEMKAKVVAKMTELKNEVTVAVMPLYKECKKYTDAVTNEVVEAAKFCYNYYNVQEKIDKIQAQVEAEYRRLDPVVRKAIADFFKMLKQEFEKMKKQAEELMAIYKKQGLNNLAEYKKFAIKNLNKNFANAKVQAAKLAQQTGHLVLRGVHSGIVAIDNFDAKQMSRQARSIAKSMSKFVDLDTKNMKLSINIPHGGSFRPTFSMNMKTLKRQATTLKIRARRAVKQVSREMNKQATRVQKVVEEVKRKAMQSKYVKNAQKTMKTVQTQATELQTKITEKTVSLYEKLMQETTEIRRDMMMVLKADTQLIKHIYNELKQLSAIYMKKAVAKYNTYKLKGMVAYKKALKQVQNYVAEAKKLCKKGTKLAMTVYQNPKPYYKQALKMAQKCMNNAEKMANVAYKQGSKYAIAAYENPTQTYNKIVAMINKYIQTLRTRIAAAYKESVPVARMMAKKYYRELKQELKDLQKMVKPYEKLAMRIKNGEPVSKVLRPYIALANRKYNKFVMKSEKTAQQIKRSVCAYDRIFCTRVMNSINVNKMIFDKYASKIVDTLMYGKVMSDRSMRRTRIMLSNIGSKTSSLAAPTYTAVGMVFGKSHVITFDQKYYDFIDYKAPDCTYVLARDFTDGKFTIMSQKNKIIVKTPGMTIKINSDGRTKTTIGSDTTSSLPVKSESGVCKRYGDFIKCYFMQQKFKVTVDLKHFAAVIGLSGWHHGKTQGLLGTNNRESYDEWRMPSGKITTDVYELANAYEVTQKSKCIAKRQKVNTPACNKKPSARCEALFASKDSPYAHLFAKINPEAFLKACQADTADCDVSAAPETAHCNATAAFTMFARASWKYAAMPAECNSVRGHEVGSSWTQKPLKRSVDVVVMISERMSVKSARNNFIKVLANIYKRMIRTGYNIKFALVGFGGHDVHEKAHTHPLNGKIFGRMGALARELSTMPYSGKGDDTNDAYHAILKASSMAFRPGASRVFVMYNTVPHVSHEHGPTYDEAMHSLVNEANATLFVFDKLVFKKINKHTIIGQSNGKMYTDNNARPALNLPKVELPASEFKDMVKATNGGLFSNKIRNQKIVRFGKSMFEGMRYWLQRDSQLCKRCTLTNTWYGIPVPVCQAQSRC